MSSAVRKNSSSLIILGAGFSYQAGMPLANGIRDYFTRDNSKTILKFSSGESRWADFADDTHLHNGRLGGDHIAYGYILNVLVQRFIHARHGSFTNYEDMYQFWIDNLRVSGFLDSVLKDAQVICLKDKPELKDNDYYMYGFRNTDASHIHSLVNHLIGDLLFCRKAREEFIAKYEQFITYIKNSDSLTIVTLNHDLLLETMIDREVGRAYADGFTRNQNILKSDNGSALNLFQNVFDKDISIIKLHGSLDMYRYDCYTESPMSATVVATGEYLYFKTLDYYEKQHPHRHDPATGQLVQSFHFAITPQFITGTNKVNLIANDYMYSSLFKKMDDELNVAEELLIVGYSFGDEHVNNSIQNALNNGTLKKVVNINPGIQFPYQKDGLEVVNLKDILELRA